MHAAHIAGRRVMAAFRTDQEVRHKGPDQPVTAADLEADASIREVLCGARPDYGWLSEESPDNPSRLERQRVWIVDPIDGTRSFVAGYAEFAICIGLAEAGRSVLAVVYNPAREELFWAVRGGGTRLAQPWRGGGPDGGGTGGAPPPSLAGGVRLSIKEAEPGRRPVLLASRSEIGRGELSSLQPEWEVRPLGSTAYKLARLAAGDGQAFLSLGPKHEWDLAGSALLVEEAGGRVTDLRGEDLAFNRPDPYVHGLVAASRSLHGPLLAQAKSLPAPRLRGGDRERAEGEG